MDDVVSGLSDDCRGCLGGCSQKTTRPDLLALEIDISLVRLPNKVHAGRSDGARLCALLSHATLGLEGGSNVGPERLVALRAGFAVPFFWHCAASDKSSSASQISSGPLFWTDGHATWQQLRTDLTLQPSRGPMGLPLSHLDRPLILLTWRLASNGSCGTVVHMEVRNGRGPI